ncbi:hypothetical protein [Rossellomorea aquimaris]|uniref:hypothetical protein n=1 Tax=Rossellomorea aquimaris TaxID=189382 RepID=UPI001CFCC161|nr:hypothetical protein [Rossellomorea aquimaris]
MNLLLWMTIGFILIGFIILTSMKTKMEDKLAYLTSNSEGRESSIKAKSIILWIASATAWGIVSIILILWCFHNHFG